MENPSPLIALQPFICQIWHSPYLPLLKAGLSPSSSAPPTTKPPPTQPPAPLHSPYPLKTAHSQPICQQAPPGACPCLSRPLTATPRFFYVPIFLSRHCYLHPLKPSCHQATLAVACPCNAGLSPTATPRFLRTHFFIYGIITNHFLNHLAIKRTSCACPVRIS